jgi:bifunctional non-homologous end joining protein LigD
MTATLTGERVSLYFRQGGSDKEYHCAVEPSGTGFVVTFAYGRRGSTLQTGTKTPTPVDHDTAKRTFDKLVREKTAKGYTPGPDGTPYAGTAAEPRSTGVLPQLLNAITESEAEPLMSDPAWWAQEKFDGRRVAIRRSDDRIIASNRMGLTAMPGSA